MSEKLKKLSKLTNNQEFVGKFLESFIFKLYEALKIRDESIIIESELKSIFGRILPKVVIGKLVNNLSEFTITGLSLKNRKKVILNYKKVFQKL